MNLICCALVLASLTFDELGGNIRMPKEKHEWWEFNVKTDIIHVFMFFIFT